MSVISGPWKIVTIAGKDRNRVTIASSNRSIGDCWTFDGLANAKLMASAPDLLRVLLEVESEYSSVMSEEMQKNIRTAINKATLI